MAMSWLLQQLGVLVLRARAVGARLRRKISIRSVTIAGALEDRSSAAIGLTDAGLLDYGARRISVIEIRKGREMRSRLPTLNRLPDLSDWKSGTPLTNILFELRTPVMIHRKSWEYALCIEGLIKLGVVKPESKAIAVGAGYETPLFYFANRIAKMVATDLYDNPEHEGRPDMLTAPEKYAPFEYHRDRLEVLRMSGADLKFQDQTFDFAFCLSSIEHFGNREIQRKALSEIKRVLKPAGIACIITEVIVEGAPHHEYFTPSELSEMFLSDPELSLVGGALSLSVSEELMNLSIDIRNGAEHGYSPHIVLSDGDRKWTSCSMFLQKGS